MSTAHLAGDRAYRHWRSEAISFGKFELINTRAVLVLAHTALATPFVVITVTATLSTYDTNLTRAALSLGAPPASVFFQVTLPNIMPGVVPGAIFAFATSFDEGRADRHQG